MPDRLTIIPRYTASEAAPAWRITLEPEYVDRRAALADLSDIDAMLAAVRSGASARGRQMDRCRWATLLPDGGLRVTLLLYVWPSDLNIPYSLSAPAGVSIGPQTAHLDVVSRKFWSAREALFDLPWMLRDPAIQWVPGLSCFDAASREVPEPEVYYVAAGARVGVKGRCYGLVHVSGLAHGFVHEISVTYDKFIPDPESTRPQINNITADDIDVTCAWRDEAGVEQTSTARMAIPACAKALLATCADGTSRFVSVHSGKPARITVYYSTCDGSVLGVAAEKATQGGAT